MDSFSQYYLLLFTFIGLFYRRWLGGGFFHCSRIWKLLVLAVLTFLMYIAAGRLEWKSWYSWFCMAWAYGWFMRYNNHTHGDYFDVNSTRPDEERSYWVGKVLKFIFGKEGYYNFWGNVIGLMLGYFVPALLASIFMPHHFFWFAGITAALTYGMCGKLFPKESFTAYAEYFNGAIMFALFYANLM